MERNFKLTIEYDGSAFHGWQRQSSDPTIQGTIEAALGKMTRSSISLIGSGRTDAGVHAAGQIANFHCDTALTPQTFIKGLNSLLPDDIVIKACLEVGDSFHARYDAKSKTYVYRICNASLPSAIGRQYSWHVRKKLDTEMMKAAIDYFVGTHDFKSFEGAGSPRSTTIRKIMAATLEAKDGATLLFTVKADGFLRFMVRNIVGTLVDVGGGRISPDDVPAILASKDRNLASATAPPHGLFLMQVDY